MEQNTTTSNNNGKGLGIAGMILGILAIILSFVPCFGGWAILLAVIGLVLSAISLVQTKKTGGQKGMAIAGLICSILAIIIGSIWLFVIAKGLGAAKEVLEHSGAMDSLTKAMDQLKHLTDTVNVPH